MEEHKNWIPHTVLAGMLSHKRSGIEGAWYYPAPYIPRAWSNVSSLHHVFKRNGQYYATPSGAAVGDVDADAGPFDTFEAAAACAIVLL